MKPLAEPAPILFLDIDGVLNCHDFDQKAMSNMIDAVKVGHLNDILEETGAVVVLSSAWRYLVHRGDMTLAGLDWLLRSHGIRSDRLIGITRPDTMVWYSTRKGPVSKPIPDERGKQITDWLKEHQHTGRYLVIDDGGKNPSGTWSSLGIIGEEHPCVWTEPEMGLTFMKTQEAINTLSRK